MKSLLSKVKMPGSKSKQKNKNGSKSDSDSESKSVEGEPTSSSIKPNEASNVIESQPSADTCNPEKAPTDQITAPSENLVNIPGETNNSLQAGSDSTVNAEKETVESEVIDASNQTIQNGQETSVEKEKVSNGSIDDQKENSTTESKPVSTSKYLNEDGVKEILGQLDIDSPSISADEKIKVLCTVFKTSITENVNYKEAGRNIIEQLDKNEQTKEALQKLCKALKQQVDLKTEEGELKLKEETQKRIDATTSFQNTISELSVLVEKHNMHNRNLQDENKALGEQLKELLGSHEKREDKIEQLRHEFSLQIQLFEAQLAKAKLEKTEITADFNKERLELQKKVMEADEQAMLMMNREEMLKEQVEIYQQQYSDIEKNIGGTTKNFQYFKKEIERVTNELKKVEMDTAEWKAKFEDSQELVKKMNYQNLDREKELEGAKRKLLAMEKLNRHLSQERTNLLKQVEDFENEKKQINGDST